MGSRRLSGMDWFLRKGQFHRLDWIQPIIDECADLFFEEPDDRLFLQQACGKSRFADILFNDEDALRCQAFLNQTTSKDVPVSMRAKATAARQKQRGGAGGAGGRGQPIPDDAIEPDETATEVFFGERFMQFFDFCATIDCLANLLDFYEKLIARIDDVGPVVIRTLEKHLPSPSFIPWEFLSPVTLDPLDPMAAKSTPSSNSVYEYRPIGNGPRQQPPQFEMIERAKMPWDRNADAIYTYTFAFYDIFNALMCGFFIQYYSTNHSAYWGRFVNHCVFDFVDPRYVGQVKTRGTTHTPNGYDVIADDPVDAWDERDTDILVNALAPRSLTRTFTKNQGGDQVYDHLQVTAGTLHFKGLITDQQALRFNENEQTRNDRINNRAPIIPGVHITLGAPGIGALDPLGSTTDKQQIARYTGQIQQTSTQQLTDKPLSVDHVIGVLQRVLPNYDHDAIPKFKSRHAALYSMRYCIDLKDALHETGFFETALKRFYALIKVFAHKRQYSKAAVRSGTSIESFKHLMRTDEHRPRTLPKCDGPDETLVLRDKDGNPLRVQDAVFTDAQGNTFVTADPYESKCEKVAPVFPYPNSDNFPEGAFEQFIGAYIANTLDSATPEALLGLYEKQTIDELNTGALAGLRIPERAKRLKESKQQAISTAEQVTHQLQEQKQQVQNHLAGGSGVFDVDRQFSDASLLAAHDIAHIGALAAHDTAETNSHGSFVLGNDDQAFLLTEQHPPLHPFNY